MTARDRRSNLAMGLCDQAAAMAMGMRPPPGAFQAKMKGPQDWVTAADGAPEQFLSRHLLEAFPEDGFQGEEEGVSRAAVSGFMAGDGLLDGNPILACTPGLAAAWSALPGLPPAERVMGSLDPRHDGHGGWVKGLCNAIL